MELCQYEFQFYNEFLDVLEEEVGNLIDITINRQNMARIDMEKHSFILRKKDSNNFMLFSEYRASYMYLVIIVCDKKYEEKLREILLGIADEIEEDYGEDHRREVRDVIDEPDNFFLELDDEFNLKELFGL